MTAPSDNPNLGDSFLVEIDGMIESTEEFIADDQITVHDDPEGRIRDLVYLVHVRDLWTDVFKPQED